MLPSLQSIQCLKVKVCKNSNQIAKCLNDKIINIDLRSLLLTKPLSQLVIGEIVRVNAQILGLSYILEFELIDTKIQKGEAFNFDSLKKDADEIYFLNLNSTVDSSKHTYCDCTCAPVIGIDKITTEKINQILIQNDNIIEYLNEMSRKDDFIMRQQEKIMENQAHFNILKNLLDTSFDYENISTSSSSSLHMPDLNREATDPIKIAKDNHDKRNMFKLEEKADNDFINISNTNASNEFDDGLKLFYSDDLNSEKGVKLELDPECNFHETLNLNSQPCTSYDSKIKLKEKVCKNNKLFTLTQKEFNRKMKAALLINIPIADQHLGMNEINEKYPDKVNTIKNSLRHFLPRGATFTMAWSKALHSIRQAKYIGKRKNGSLG